MGIFSSLLGGALSLFGANKARRQAKQDALNKFVDLRAAADAGGINVLTALGATGGAGFGNYGGAPPLASVELLTGAMADIEDEANGTAAQRRATDRLNYDLAKIRVDQARSGVYEPPPPKTYAAAGSTVFADNTARAYPAGRVKIFGGFGGPFPLELGKVPVPDPTLDRGSGVFVADTYVAGAPGWSSAQTIEDNYGDAASWLYGAAKAAADFSYRRSGYLNKNTVGTPIFRQGREVLSQLTPPQKWRADDASKHPPKARGYQKNIYDPRPLFQQWDVR